MTYTYKTIKTTKYSSRYGSAVTGITIHHWGIDGQKHDNVARYLATSNSNSNAHEVISAGKVTHLVDFQYDAWHAGNTTGNRTTIGLECRPEMSPADYTTVVERIADIEKQLGKRLKIVGHKDWKATACPGRWYPKLAQLRKDVDAAKKPKPKETPLMVTKKDEEKIRAIVKDEVSSAFRSALSDNRASQLAGWILRGDGDARIGLADIWEHLTGRRTKK